jgi:hypothetical protein
LIDDAKARAKTEKGDESVTEIAIHVVTAQNVHLYRERDADEVLTPDEPIPEKLVL